MFGIVFGIFLKIVDDQEIGPKKFPVENQGILINYDNLEKWHLYFSSTEVLLKYFPLKQDALPFS